MVFARLIAMALGSVGATITSQLPEFAQQYRQRIGGAIDALEDVRMAFEVDAQKFGMSVSEAVAYMQTSADAFFQQRGDSMAMALARLEALKGQQAAMEGAGPMQRIWVFMQAPDTKLAQAAWADFEPAVPVTLEALLIGGAGFACGLICYSLLKGTGKAAARGMRKRPVRG